MPDDPIQAHNAAKLDEAAALLVRFGQLAVGKNPFGTLTLRLEWRSGVLIRRTINEEHTELTPTPGAA